MLNKLLLIIGLLSLQLAVWGQTEKQLQMVIDSYHEYQDSVSDTRQSSWRMVNDSSMKDMLKKYRHWEQALSEIDTEQLSNNSLINYDLLTLLVGDQIFNLENGSHQMPLTSEGGFITGMIYSTSGLNLDDGEAKQNYIDKLRQAPAYINQQITNLRSGLTDGKSLPKIIIEKAVVILDGILETDAENMFLSKPLTEDIKETGMKIIRDEIIPSFQQLHSFLSNEYLPKSRDVVGIHATKDGKKYYEQRVHYFTTLDITPEEVFNTGMSEVERIRSEMDVIIAELAFEGDYKDFLEFLRTDEQFYAKTPQQILNEAAWLSKKAEEILPKYFGKLPRLPFTVTPVPDAIAANYTSGRYSGGSMDSGRAGQYWVNTHNLNSRPLYALPALTLHEAVPGHHLQISLAKEIKDIPRFRNRMYLSAYGEGWGLYSEYLGKEAGIYSDAYADFGRLTYEMWRACRLVVDPGMHYMGWTREEAVEFMASNTALSLHEVNTEINRYIGWPGQAVSYKIGELKIRELRKKAEKELGDKFDIRSFHDMILSQGSVPLYTLERMTNSYIDERKKQD